jgi:hypothetical protein
MRNKFPGQCYRCGKQVAAGAGHFERPSTKTLEKLGLVAVRNRWLIQHADCAIKYRGTNHAYWKKDEGNA